MAQLVGIAASRSPSAVGRHPRLVAVRRRQWIGQSVRDRMGVVAVAVVVVVAGSWEDRKADTVWAATATRRRDVCAPS